MGTMLIGYNVEWRAVPRATRSLHNRLGVPATLFVVGQTLERWVSQFQAIADDPLVDIQQHTYTH
jgi:peptidoglycan/xylan/chitin deacetylase (PgdA/CDA1 family)